MSGKLDIAAVLNWTSVLLPDGGAFQIERTKSTLVCVGYESTQLDGTHEVATLKRQASYPEAVWHPPARAQQVTQSGYRQLQQPTHSGPALYHFDYSIAYPGSEEPSTCDNLMLVVPKSQSPRDDADLELQLMGVEAGVARMILRAATPTFAVEAACTGQKLLAAHGNDRSATIKAVNELLAMQARVTRATALGQLRITPTAISFSDMSSLLRGALRYVQSAQP